MIFFNKEFKQYDDYYYVSADGGVYSKYSHKLLKHYINLDGYHRVDIHGKHMKIHKLVYLTWHGPIPQGLQINHFDDDKDNNNYLNLYAGSQKANIADCCVNQHRVGNMQTVVVYDKSNATITTYPTVRDFLQTTGHSVQNGSLSKVRNRNWFRNRYVIIEQKGVSTIESYKSIRAAYSSWVENKAIKHEASRVGQSLSLPEAQGFQGDYLDSRDSQCGQ